MVPLHSPPPSSPPSPRVRSPPSPYIGHETDGSRIYIYIYNISVNINITRRVNYKKISRGYIRWWTCDGKISLLQSLSHPPSPPPREALENRAEAVARPWKTQCALHSVSARDPFVCRDTQSRWIYYAVHISEVRFTDFDWKTAGYHAS